jgi:hypothetical protein
LKIVKEEDWKKMKSFKKGKKTKEIYLNLEARVNVKRSVGDNRGS